MDYSQDVNYHKKHFTFFYSSNTRISGGNLNFDD